MSSNFTKEMIENYADKLLIGLDDEEVNMIQSEFDQIEKKINLINNIPNIESIEPLSYPFEMTIDSLRDDTEEEDYASIEELLQNCKQYEGREVEVPKVVV